MTTGETGAAMRTPRVLSIVLAVVMAGQALTGLVFSDQYRDVGFVRETWFGNDGVTLVLAVPLLLVALVLEQRGSARGRLLWLGALGYGIYNYAFYLFGTALNIFFPLYVTAFLLSALALVLALMRTGADDIAKQVHPRTPIRFIGGYFVFVAIGLAAVWLAMWAAYVFGGRPTPIETEAFKLVAALDLTFLVPALLSGGILLWRRRPYGYLIAAIAGIQGSLYLLVLALNSIIFIARGLVEAPGELAVWLPLTVATWTATMVLLVNVGRQDRSASKGA